MVGSPDRAETRTATNASSSTAAPMSSVQVRSSSPYAVASPGSPKPGVNPLLSSARGGIQFLPVGVA